MIWETLLSLATLGFWTAPLLDALRAGNLPRKLSEIPPGEDPDLPRLSVVVPALNEGQTIGKAMRSLLALDYPDYEIIAINDRSTDNTGAVLDQLAAESGGRLRVVHVESLPEGWLGKNHAMQLGGEAARGELLLFTDADVHFDRSALRRAASFFQRDRLDFMGIFFDVELHGFWETVSVNLFTAMYAQRFRPLAVHNPESSAYAGVGAFTMVRATTYRRFGGHRPLRLDVIDDVKMGKLMKRLGGRCMVMTAGDLIRVRWIQGVRGIIGGFEKNAYAGTDYKPVVAILGSILTLVFCWWPFLGFFATTGLAWGLTAAAFVAMLILGATHRPRADMGPLWGITYPLGALVFAPAILNSMIRNERAGGVRWRGTLYDLKELKKLNL